MVYIYQFEHSSTEPILSETINETSNLINENGHGSNEAISNSQGELPDLSIQLKSYRVRNVGRTTYFCNFKYKFNQKQI